MAILLCRPIVVFPPGRSKAGLCKKQGKPKWRDAIGWQRQAQSSKLGDGGFPARKTIAKAFGLDAATRLIPSVSPFFGTLRLRWRKEWLKENLAMGKMGPGVPPWIEKTYVSRSHR